MNSEQKLKDIWFAGGCFWGLEKYFSLVPGVINTAAGYANGNTEQTTYEEVCRGDAAFAETVQVTYDSFITGLENLVFLFYKAVDPTTVNRQGNDRGIQYRTGIYYTSEEDAEAIRRVTEEVRKKYASPLAVEIKPLKNFIPAEEYHQKYLDKNPSGYCHIGKEQFEAAKRGNIDPADYERPPDSVLKDVLSPVQYQVALENGTERPFGNEYWDEHRKGIYVDITTGEPLFSSRDKFDSGCGWPSFSKPVDPAVTVEKEDASHGMDRTEVRSRSGNIHLGHVFDDGPRDRGGLRYCINSASLRFIPEEKMEEEGYGAYLPFV
ncbi:peptide-methionine (R)-S-oxide reductase MsrB [Brucepastera parasyntrophica]|uniref:peptide-methionine (R)-S-oxide reductase MsrB n=1 Tax=Brucepastera parasyntrophica TaxID=2880008 RepID=UPI00210E80A9|nr:peptide-methionine (R)-S-oxide reductase MsrB [Brucepastera parasyntrophica]ULQ60727.1 peptide-methionine (R)-S-oxide reductase MsrB [Brucepastera parasyntrophica]